MEEEKPTLSSVIDSGTTAGKQDRVHTVSVRAAQSLLHTAFRLKTQQTTNYFERKPEEGGGGVIMISGRRGGRFGATSCARGTLPTVSRAANFISMLSVPTQETLSHRPTTFSATYKGVTSVLNCVVHP